jgi:hypothetical protein
MGFVYLLLETDKNGDERHKIGITKNPVEKRIKQLQTGNSNIITLLHSYQTEHYRNVEHMLHKKFINQKTETKNEWFYLEDEQVLGFLKTCAELNERVILLKENNPFYK